MTETRDEQRRAWAADFVAYLGHLEREHGAVLEPFDRLCIAFVEAFVTNLPSAVGGGELKAEGIAGAALSTSGAIGEAVFGMSGLDLERSARAFVARWRAWAGTVGHDAISAHETFVMSLRDLDADERRTRSGSLRRTRLGVIGFLLGRRAEMLMDLRPGVKRHAASILRKRPERDELDDAAAGVLLHFVERRGRPDALRVLFLGDDGRVHFDARSAGRRAVASGLGAHERSETIETEDGGTESVRRYRVESFAPLALTPTDVGAPLPPDERTDAPDVAAEHSERAETIEDVVRALREDHAALAALRALRGEAPSLSAAARDAGLSRSSLRRAERRVREELERAGLTRADV